MFFSKRFSAALQALDQRVVLLESILSELVSSGINTGVTCSASALSGSIQELPKAEPPKKAGRYLNSLWSRDRMVSVIDLVMRQIVSQFNVVTLLDQTPDGTVPELHEVQLQRADQMSLHSLPFGEQPCRSMRSTVMDCRAGSRMDC